MLLNKSLLITRRRSAIITRKFDGLLHLLLQNLMGSWASLAYVSMIANVDQTPLPFTFKDMMRRVLKLSGSVEHNQSGLDKRQCTVQLTIFTNGEPHVKPLLFSGVRNKNLEYDKVKFQENGWCDEIMMYNWVSIMWRRLLCTKAI